MIRHYLKIAFRNLVRHKGYTALTLAGLAVGVAAFLLIGVWVLDELSYDRFQEKGGRIYRAIWDARVGDNAWKIPLVPVPLADALREGFPEVEKAVRVSLSPQSVRHDGMLQKESGFMYAEPSFFDVFTVRFLAGNPGTALNDKDNVVLTRQTALRYFGTADAIGKRIELSDGTVFKVTGIVEAFPAQSHLRFDFIAPLEAYEWFHYRRTQWGAATVYTYMLLKEGSSFAQFNGKMQSFVKRTILSDPLFADPNNHSGFIFQPLYDIYLGADYGFSAGPQGNSRTVYLFSVVGVFILLLACVNFVNLSTARSTRRAREVGVRKVAGSTRRQLVYQFLAESAVIVLCAVILGILLVEVALPWLNALTGKDLSLHYASPLVIVWLAGVTVVLTVLSGTYPAFVISSFSPVRAFRGVPGRSFARSGFRNMLVVFQFCICIALMIGTIVVRGQLSFMLGKQLGFDREHVLVVRGIGALRDKRGVFTTEVERSPQVSAVSVVQTLPGYGFDSNLFEPEQPANFKQTSLTYDMVDDKFVDVLGLKVIEGRNFSRHLTTDSSAFLINRSAATALGWTHPVGMKLNSGDAEGPVVGVVEDFNYESLHSAIKPIVFPFNHGASPRLCAIRLRPGDVTDQVEFVGSIWHRLLPERPFEYSFLDQDYEKLYGSEQKLARMFGLFSGLALAIACLGLFGLAAYTIEQRTKEIGIRKVLGASVTGVVGLLSKEFGILVLIANLVAWPLAYYAMNKWLQDFAYQIDIGIGTFLIAGLTAFAIALLTVGYEAVRAALSNPVDALRYE